MPNFLEFIGDNNATAKIPLSSTNRYFWDDDYLVIPNITKTLYNWFSDHTLVYVKWHEFGEHTADIWRDSERAVILRGNIVEIPTKKF